MTGALEIPPRALAGCDDCEIFPRDVANVPRPRNPVPVVEVVLLKAAPPLAVVVGVSFPPLPPRILDAPVALLAPRVLPLALLLPLTTPPRGANIALSVFLYALHILDAALSLVDCKGVD